ncbi:MAG: hypothetical protein IT289_04275 [Oligoflexia bacterium]|nr:hypothetical protein [Oligoflexia bacterium]
MKYLIALLSVGFLVGCDSNPYGDEGKLYVERPEVVKVAPAFVIDAYDLMEFSEGAESVFEIKGHVPGPGKPNLTVEGLPSGAVFDETTGKLKWTPDYSAGDNGNFDLKAYKIKAVLRSSTDGVSTVKKEITLVVHNRLRDFYVDKFDTFNSLYEGQTHEIKIKIFSDDFPNGPFKIGVSELPEGAKIIRSAANPNLFSVRYSPGYTTTDYSIYKEWAVEVIDPKGRALSLKGTWYVYDSILTPTVKAPSKIETQTLTASFIITIEDSTGVGIPTLMVNGALDGNVVITNLAAAVKPGFNYRVAQVEWKDLPASYYQTVKRLSYSACVNNGNSGPDACLDHFVDISFTGVAPTPGPAAINKGEK